jgi:hypothetical protein
MKRKALFGGIIPTGRSTEETLLGEEGSWFMEFWCSCLCLSSLIISEEKIHLRFEREVDPKKVCSIYSFTYIQYDTPFVFISLIS